jgi:uncharacterized protein YegP (UPF0339 family)
MAGKFELHQGTAGNYRFSVKAGNGPVIAAGEAHESRPAAEKSIASLRKSAPGAPVVEVDG